MKSLFVTISKSMCLLAFIMVVFSCSKDEDPVFYPVDIVSWIKPYQFRDEITWPMHLAGKSDNGFLISGYIGYNNTVATHGFVINMDLNGDTIWCKQIDIEDYTRNDVCFAMEHSGGIIIAGICGYIGEGKLRYMAWLDASGQIIKHVILPGIPDYWFYPNCSIVPLDNGSMYYACSLEKLDEETADRNILRVELLDESGEILRSKDYLNVINPKILYLGNGNLLVTGNSNTGHSIYDNKLLYLFIDEDGNEVDRQLFGTEESNSYNEADGICHDYEGGYLISGILTYSNLGVIYPFTGQGVRGNYTTVLDTIYSYGNMIMNKGDGEYFVLFQAKTRLYFLKYRQDFTLKGVAWIDNEYPPDTYPIYIPNLVHLPDGGIAFLYVSHLRGYHILIKITPRF